MARWMNPTGTVKPARGGCTQHADIIRSEFRPTQDQTMPDFLFFRIALLLARW